MTERVGHALLALLLLITLWMAFFMPRPVEAACEPYPVGPHSPTGIVGCEIYGEGIASMWGGPGVARNDCVYPWTNCTIIRITVLATGAWIAVRPTMYCDCYTGTANERIVDLGPDEVAALGLDPALGLWPVRVEQLGELTLLPNTAMAWP